MRARKNAAMRACAPHCCELVLLARPSLHGPCRGANVTLTPTGIQAPFFGVNTAGSGRKLHASVCPAISSKRPPAMWFMSCNVAASVVVTWMCGSKLVLVN